MRPRDGAASVSVPLICTGLKCADLRLGDLRRDFYTGAMKIAKPLLMVSTPLGVAWGLLEAYRLAGGLVILMAAMVGMLGVAAGTVVAAIRREKAAAGPGPSPQPLTHSPEAK